MSIVRLKPHQVDSRMVYVDITCLSACRQFPHGSSKSSNLTSSISCISSTSLNFKDSPLTLFPADVVFLASDANPFHFSKYMIGNGGNGLPFQQRERDGGCAQWLLLVFGPELIGRWLRYHSMSSTVCWRLPIHKRSDQDLSFRFLWQTWLFLRNYLGLGFLFALEAGMKRHKTAECTSDAPTEVGSCPWTLFLDVFRCTPSLSGSFAASMRNFQ